MLNINIPKKHLIKKKVLLLLYNVKEKRAVLKLMAQNHVSDRQTNNGNFRVTLVLINQI